jgi:citrate/tricarballylate utilization protein
MLTTDSHKEADRLITVCNSCRYCEGLCAVFPAIEARRTFSAGDINYLANLCHGCGACYYDCQFSPPHEFNVNVPRVFARVRADSYQDYAWPRFLSPLFTRNGLFISVFAALSVAAFILAFVAAHDRSVLWSAQLGPGAFYRLMPHNAMVWLFGGAFLYAIIAIALGLRAFWRDIPDLQNSATPRSLWQAMKDTAQLRYLDGGGVGCMNEGERPTDNRRLFHHLTLYGFLLCIASTSAATVYHYVLNYPAPYAWYAAPVLLGTSGGLGMIIGAGGLLAAKWARDPMLVEQSRYGMDVAFIAMLFLTALTGLALLVCRETFAMPLLLSLHLGVVFAFFVTLPYSNFVHGLYRFIALVRYAQDRKS